MKKVLVMISLFFIPVIILLSILIGTMKAYKPQFEVKIENKVLTISNFEEKINDNSTKINLKDIVNLEYLPGFLINRQVGEAFGGSFNGVKFAASKVNLVDGKKNVNLISLNNHGSGVYLNCGKSSYLLVTKTDKETKELFEKIKKGQNFSQSY